MQNNIIKLRQKEGNESHLDGSKRNLKLEYQASISRKILVVLWHQDVQRTNQKI